MDDEIFFAKYYRVMQNQDQVILGNILENGQWIKIPLKVYQYLKYKIENRCTIRQIIDQCQSDKEKEFYNDLLKNLIEIRVLTFEEKEETKLDSVSLLLTTDCNLRCRHCASSYGDIPKVIMSMELLQNIINWAEELEIKNLTLTGGEIFTVPNIIELIEMVHKNFSGDLDIITNATLIKPEHYETIKRCVTRVNISLDGYDEDSVSKIRGKNVYDKVINIIHSLKDAGITKISLSMVMVEYNREHIQRFYDLCKSLEVKPMLRMLNPKGRAKDNYQEYKFKIENDELTEQKLKDLKKSINMKSICSAGISTLAIAANGVIYPCASMDSNRYIIGNFRDILNGNLQLNQLNLYSTVDRVIECKDCNVKYFCASSCRDMNESIYYDTELKKDYCSQRKKHLVKAAWGI